MRDGRYLLCYCGMMTESTFETAKVSTARRSCLSSIKTINANAFLDQGHVPTSTLMAEDGRGDRMNIGLLLRVRKLFASQPRLSRCQSREDFCCSRFRPPCVNPIGVSRSIVLSTRFNSAPRREGGETAHARRKTSCKKGRASSNGQPVLALCRGFFPLLVLWLNVILRIRRASPTTTSVFPSSMIARFLRRALCLSWEPSICRRDAGNKIARHRLSAKIEDKEDVRGWLSVKKKASRNDFVSVANLGNEEHTSRQL